MLIIIAYLPKSSQNTAKSIQNLEKSFQNRSQNRSGIPNVFQTCPERDFFRFWVIFWRPRDSQNRTKIVKHCKKTPKNQSQKNTCQLTQLFSNFLRFGLRKRSQNQARFATSSKTSILWKLAKNIKKNNGFIDFSGFGPPENDPKSMPKRIWKKNRKKASKKSIRGSMLASETPRNRSKIEPGPRKWQPHTKLVSRRYGNHPRVVGS